MDKRTCTICKNELPLTEEFFASRKGVKKTRFQSTCRNCQKEYRKLHYEQNKTKYKKKSSDYKKEFMQWFFELKSKLACKVCGEDRYWVLDFHHRDPNFKDTEVSVLLRSCSKGKVLEEIEKCDVLCANCHRDLHYKRKAAVVQLVECRPSKSEVCEFEPHSLLKTETAKSS